MLIYLITCSRCSLQDIEGASQKLNKRLNWHRTGFNQPGIMASVAFQQIISKKMSVVMFVCQSKYQKKVKENGRTCRNALDDSITSRKKQRDKTWMLKLRSVYPYGVNDSLGDEYTKVNTHVFAGNKFPLLPKRKRQSFSWNNS